MSVEIVHVFYDGLGDPVPVGRLAAHKHKILFQYTEEFLALNLQISPYKLLRKRGIIEGDPGIFEGLHGVFDDSLPDGWGRLLLDRKIRELGQDPSALTPLDRLSYVGKHGMGALSYQPEYEAEASDKIDLNNHIELDKLADETQSILEGTPSEVLDQMYALAAGSGGARPKILVGCTADKQQLAYGTNNYSDTHQPWIIKFRGGDLKNGMGDTIDCGAIEFAYSRMAEKAGIDVPETHLFPSKKGPGYFGAKRFDLVDGLRHHVHSVCGLLNADYRLPSMSYEMLLRVTRDLTKDQRDVEQMYRRMAFNVMTSNQDDHTKNFAFMMSSNGKWKNSPGYDITYSRGVGAEHAMTVNGKGKGFTGDDLMKVADSAGIAVVVAKGIIEEVNEAISTWSDEANTCGVSKSNIQSISKTMAPIKTPTKKQHRSQENGD